MKYNFTAPNAKSLRSAHAIVETSAAIAPVKRVPWEMQRRVPKLIADSIQREREARAARGILG